MTTCSKKLKTCSKTEPLTGERIDNIGFGILRLIQDPGAFCYGVDAVILSHFTAGFGRPAKRILDLGTGTGIIPLILSHMTDANEILGIELQEDSYRRACRNVELNGLSDSVRIIHGDVKDADELKKAAGLFDIVVTNPPYIKKSAGIVNKTDAKHVARHETTAELADFINTAATLLLDKGNFFMVHRPERLVDICTFARAARLEPKTLRFVSPNKNHAPNIILVHCVKFGRSGLSILDPLYIYNEDGNYTEEVLRIYERE